MDGHAAHAVKLRNAERILVGYSEKKKHGCDA
jgi:hypothetical protein